MRSEPHQNARNRNLFVNYSSSDLRREPLPRPINPTRRHSFPPSWRQWFLWRRCFVLLRKECFRWNASQRAEEEHNRDTEHAKYLEPRLRRLPPWKPHRRTRGEQKQHRKRAEAKDTGGGHQLLFDHA